MGELNSTLDTDEKKIQIPRDSYGGTMVRETSKTTLKKTKLGDLPYQITRSI